MKLIVGLGNPGRKYAGTRHNVGFEALDALAARHALTWEAAPRGVEALAAPWRTASAIAAKPMTFMNASGPAVVGLLQFYKVAPEDLLVVVDDVYLEAGRLRARAGGSAGGHNGLKSIIGALGTDVFPRLRIGVGRGDAQRGLADHVLSRIDAAERGVVEDAVGRAAEAAERFVVEGIIAVMNQYNRPEPSTTDNGIDEGHAPS